MTSTIDTAGAPRYTFGTSVEAVTRHGGLLRWCVSAWERGIVIHADEDSARYRVVWPGGRRTTSYPWHIQAVGERPFYTADVVALSYNEHGEQVVLLIRRSPDSNVYPGRLALPGGHVDLGERARRAAAREAVEETGISIADAALIEVGVFDRPDRDPRGRYVSDAFVAVLDYPAQPTAGDDASEAEWVPVATLDADQLAFDHHEILAAALACAAAATT